MFAEATYPPTKYTKESDMTSNQQPEILAIVHWLQGITDPVERIRQATLLIDEARDHLLPELASVRRLAAVEARKRLVDEGMSVFEANRFLGENVGMSPQTIMRLISERKHYGG